MKFKRFISLVLVAIMLFTVPVFANEEPAPEPEKVMTTDEVYDYNRDMLASTISEYVDAEEGSIDADNYYNYYDDIAKAEDGAEAYQAYADFVNGNSYNELWFASRDYYNAEQKTDEERYQEARGEKPALPPLFPSPLPGEITQAKVDKGVITINGSDYTVVCNEEGNFVLADEEWNKYNDYSDITGDKEPLSKYVDAFIKNVEYNTRSSFYNNFPSQEEWLNDNPSARVKYEQALSNYNNALAKLQSALNDYFNPTPNDDPAPAPSPDGGDDPIPTPAPTPDGLPTIIQAVVDAYNNLVETVKSYFVEESSDYVTINAMASNFKFNVYQTDPGFKNEVDKFIKDFQLRYYSASPRTQKAFDELYVLWLFAQ